MLDSASKLRGFRSSALQLKVSPTVPDRVGTAIIGVVSVCDCDAFLASMPFVGSADAAVDAGA